MSKFSLKYILLFLIIIAPIVSAIEYTCGPEIEDLKVGDYATICIHILNEDQKLAMSVQVDEYNTIAFSHINEIFNSVSANGTIQFLAQINKTITKFPIVSLNFLIINI